jgi:hypothetical protein
MNVRRLFFSLFLCASAGSSLCGAARASMPTLSQEPTHLHRALHPHHRHAHSVAVPNLVARTARGSAPSPPSAPHRNGHRPATVPHTVHRLSAPRTLKSGSQAPLALSGSSEHRQAIGWARRENLDSHRISRERAAVSSRGPPRASPIRLALPSRATASPPGASSGDPLASLFASSPLTTHRASTNFVRLPDAQAVDLERGIPSGASLPVASRARRLASVSPSSGGFPC